MCPHFAYKYTLQYIYLMSRIINQLPSDHSFLTNTPLSSGWKHRMLKHSLQHKEQTHQRMCHHQPPCTQESRAPTGSLLGSSDPGQDPLEEDWEQTFLDIPEMRRGKSLRDRIVDCCARKAESRGRGGCTGIHRFDLRSACHPGTGLPASDTHQCLKICVTGDI